jgi:hypothetical protein
MALAVISELRARLDPGMQLQTGEWRLQNSRYKAILRYPLSIRLREEAFCGRGTILARDILGVLQWNLWRTIAG